MHKVPVVSNFEDERGVIADLVTEPLDGATLLFTAVGAVRGNHFHRETHQWTYVASGRLTVATRECGSREITRATLSEGELLYSPPFEEHAWRADEPTVTVVLTRGPRTGEDYESDTYRLDPDDLLIRP